MISNWNVGSFRSANRVLISAIGMSLLAASWPDAAFGQDGPVCSNQAQIDACVRSTCGVCGFFDLTDSGVCDAPEALCQRTCIDALFSCQRSCQDADCIAGCRTTNTNCHFSCTATCDTCVTQCRGPCDNLCVVCDAGGPYSIACDTDGAPIIQLNGSGSSDPQDDGLTYKWTTTCPGATFNDDEIESPQLTLATPLNCLECSVTLTVTEEDGGTSTCTAAVNVTDDERPTVGTPAQLTECFTSSAAARQAACAALLAVAEDNCDTDLFCNTFTIGEPAECGDVIYAFVEDDCDNSLEASVPFEARIDGERPTATCSAGQAEYVFDEDCKTVVRFTGHVEDNCCLDPSGPLPIDLANPGGGTESLQNFCKITKAPSGIGLDIECEYDVKWLTHCPSPLVWSFNAEDCCGNALAEPCVATTSVVDKTKPVITCPDSITLDRGDKICNDDVKNWLESATATDSCNGEPTITTDAPECGFPYGSTTEVTFTATDDCGNTSSCTSTITIEATPRVSGTQKGSLLIYSDVEIRWNDQGVLVQDTILDVSNDADRGSVDVQAWFINGDRPIEEIVDINTGNILQEFEPGWNTADCRFELTKNQPHYWSAARGSNKCQPFTVLDDNGRPGGSRVLRGYVVMTAVKFTNSPSNLTAGFEEPGSYQEIRWNHLKGDAVVIDYERGAAWEYNAIAYQARCGAEGEPLLDCVKHDDKGTCCEAYVIPGNLDMDGFQYDANFDVLLLDFYASGSTAFTRGNVTVMVDTDLTLHTADADLRQDGNGPVLIKAEFEIYNENESKFSGLRRCICCWDQTLLSDYVRDVSIPSYFMRSVLRTDKGMARINGVFSEECDYEEICGMRQTRALAVRLGDSRPLLGVAAKELTFSGTTENRETAGMNLPGSGTESATIRFDVDAPDPTLQSNGSRAAPTVRVGSGKTTRGLDRK